MSLKNISITLDIESPHPSAPSSMPSQSHDCIGQCVDMLCTSNVEHLQQSSNQMVLSSPLQNSGMQVGSSVGDNLDIPSSISPSEQGSQDSGFHQENRRRLITEVNLFEASSASTAKRQRRDY